MCRATVIGNAGGGKSTLCKKLSASKQLPLHSVDTLQWQPGWVLAPQTQLAEDIREIIRQDKWILDGWGPWETIEERCEYSDTIILVDLSLWTHIYWAAKRQIKALFFPHRIDSPEGCNYLPMTWKLFRTIWSIHRNFRPKLLELVEQFRGRKAIYHIESPSQLKAFIAQHC